MNKIFSVEKIIAEKKIGFYPNLPQPFKSVIKSILYEKQVNKLLNEFRNERDLAFINKILNYLHNYKILKFNFFTSKVNFPSLSDIPSITKHIYRFGMSFFMKINIFEK